MKGLHIFAVLFAAASMLNAQSPMLVVDAGGHTAPMRTLVFTSDGRYLVSAGDDKEIRIWNTQTGAAIRTIRGQIATGPDGKINTIALSAADRYLAIGGWLTNDDGKGSLIRILDFKTGAVLRILKGHENVVEGLAFSPDGAQVASASADGTVRIWDMATGRELKKLRGDSLRVHTVAFSSDGMRIAAGSVGGGLRLWRRDGKLIANLMGHRGDVVGVTFDASDELLASVSEDRSVRLWDAKTGSFVKEIRIGGDGVANLSFTTGSGPRRLLVSYFSMQLGHGVCDMISVPDGAVRAQFVRHENAVMATALSPDSRFAASAGGDHEIYVWQTDSGRDIRKLAGRGKIVRSVAFARDGRSIAFGVDAYAQRQPNAHGPLQRTIWLRKDNAYSIDLGGGVRAADFQLAEVRKGDYSLQASQSGNYGGWAVLEIQRNGKAVGRIRRDETSGYEHLSFTFTPDGQYVISGGMGGVLTIHNAQNGTQSGAFVGHTGQVLALAVSPDGRTLVSGSDDQTIRLWDVQTRRQLLTLFVGSNDEWAAWTPEGYYTSSLTGDSYIGWHINQGRDKSAKYFSAVQFQKSLYRPDVVEQRLGRLGPGQGASMGSAVAKMLPPEIQVTVPANTAAPTVQAAIKITSAGLPVTAVRVFMNGAQVLASLTPTGSNSRERTFDVRLPLHAGTNSLQVVAANNGASTRGEEWTIVREARPDDAKSKEAEKGDLYVLAIGLSQYENAAVPPLQFADKDATDVAAALKRQEGIYFRTVRTTVLRNSEATKARIEDELTRLQQSGDANDTRVLYLAGHGGMHVEGYHFWGFQHDTTGNPKGDVSWSLITNRFSAAPGKNVLLVDTCRAGGVTGGVDFNQVLKRTGDENPALLVFAASTATEKSFEFQQLGHGVFTDALLKTLALPPGRQRVQEIYSDELGVRLRKQVQDYLKGYCARTNNPADPAVKLGCQQTPVHFALPIGLKASPLFASSSP